MFNMHGIVDTVLNGEQAIDTHVVVVGKTDGTH
jgi:hypothetical protein